jgi:hypothetical protein
MVDPSKHAERRGWIESALRHITGFQGYLEKEYRRESDALLRAHLADRLQAAKRGVTQFQRDLLDAGRLDDLAAVERVVTGIDALANRLRGSVRGYSGFFDFVQINEAELDRVYEQDLQLLGAIDTFVEHTQNLPTSAGSARSIASQLQSELDGLGEKYGHRDKILSGLEPNP